MSPPILADAGEVTPKLDTLGVVLTLVRLTRGLAVFDNFGQVDRHVAVDVEDLTVDDKTAEAAYQSLPHRRCFQVLAEVIESKIYISTFHKGHFKEIYVIIVIEENNTKVV